MLGYPRTQVDVCLIMCVLFVVLNQHYSEITIGLVSLTTFNLEKNVLTSCNFILIGQIQKVNRLPTG